MKILTHVDSGVLERELVARVDASHRRGAVGSTLLLVPTQRLGEHILRRLAGVRPAWLGLHVLSFPALGREVLERTRGTTLHVAHPLLLEALLRRLLDERPANLWSAFVRRRPGAAGRVLETLGDLREAGIEPEELAACAGGARPAVALAELYTRYHAALESAAAAGWTDPAGLARAARPHAAAFGKTVSSVFVHGAYEIVGVYLELIRELDRTTDVTLLAPIAPGSRVTAYAERFAALFLGGSGEALATPGDSRLAALYDEESAPAPAPPGSYRFRHAQGSAAEVKYAVREALRSVREGCPPTEIAIAARSLEPYAAALEEAFEDEGLPWTSALGSPLRRHPVVRELLLLLRVAADGFPRGPTVELLHARHLSWRGLGCAGPPPAALADRWSREAAIVEGLEEWTDWLERWAATPRERGGPDDEREPERAERRRGDARRIGEALRRVDAAVRREDATWGEHAAALSGLLDAAFRTNDGAAVDQLGEILDAMRDLERLVGETARVPFATMRSWLEQAVDASRLTLRREDDGGIRVLDAMQMRGCTFRQLHLLGMNGGLFPRAPRADPILGDGVRRALREKTGRPIRVEGEAADEEQLLLALLLGAASERVDLSWQRADESGRAKVASPALREVARIALGRPELESARAAALHLPSHPRQWLDRLVDGPGMLSPGEAMLLAALNSRAADAATRLGERFPDLLPGLEMLRATQSFQPVNDAYDARIGPREGELSFSVTSLATLGRCPLQFFFKNVLRVAELQEPTSPFDLARNEIGSRIHQLLEEVWEVLRSEGAFDGKPERLVRRGLELLDERRGRVLGEIGARQAVRLPRLWEQLARSWFATLRRFVEDDLRHVAEAGLVPTSLEELASKTLDFGDGYVATVRGKFDRLLAGPAGPVVGDYKTSSNLDWHVNPTKMLKAHTLQVPLYAMMAGPGSTVELLGVHPDLDPADGEHRKAFGGFTKPALARSFQQTMRVVLRLYRDGSFPFNPDEMYCGWCKFEKACPRNHPPTQDREEQLTDATAFRNLQKKNERSPDVP